MMELYRRIGKLVQVDPSNLEAIYHLYAPGAEPANIHLDNFNKFLFPHRYASISMFFEDQEEGATVFPLLRATDQSPASPVATAQDDIMAWHSLINATRMEPGSDGYAYRRVDGSEWHPFRRHAFQAALAMCRGGHETQGPVFPEKGTAYMWKNYLTNGEDDLRTIHAGCGSTTEFKILGTFFLRDWPGPYQEHSSFWDLQEENEKESGMDEVEELRRLVEMSSLQSFRIRHMEELYAEQRKIAKELQGPRAAERLLQQQKQHLRSLLDEDVEDEATSRIGDLVKNYGGTEIAWTKVVAADRVF